MWSTTSFWAWAATIRSDVNDPRYAAFYGPAHNWLEAKDGGPLASDFTYVSPAWANDWLARGTEIVEKYHPEIVYFDWWIGQPSLRPYLPRFMAFYYNESLHHGGQVGVIDYKDLAMQEHSAVLDVERGQLGGIRELHWQTDTSVSDQSWGYIENDNFKSAQSIIDQLVDIVSKNGNLLLNVGPRSDGTIPDGVQQILLDLGGWLKLNGDAIYDTRPWKIFGEGPTKVSSGAFHDRQAAAFTAEDFRFTVKDATLFAIELGWPSKGESVIHALGTKGEYSAKIESVTLLGSAAKLHFQQEEDGLHIELPANPPCKYAYSFRIVFTGS